MNGENGCEASLFGITVCFILTSYAIVLQPQLVYAVICVTTLPAIARSFQLAAWTPCVDSSMCLIT